jgi:hypothetical protein
MLRFVEHLMVKAFVEDDPHNHQVYSDLDGHWYAHITS